MLIGNLQCEGFQFSLRARETEAIDPQEDGRGRNPGAFVAIDERVVVDQGIEQGSRFFKQAGIQLLTVSASAAFAASGGRLHCLLQP